MEQNNDGTKYSKKMAVYRADPIIFYVNSEPFLDTADLEQATLMEAIGGFAIQFQFNRHGHLLPVYRTASPRSPNDYQSKRHRYHPVHTGLLPRGSRADH